MDLTPQQRLEEAERVRRHRQGTEVEKSGVPSMTRDEYLKLHDENIGLLIEIVKRLGVAEGEALAAARHGLDLLAALPAGSDFDDPALLFRSENIGLLIEIVKRLGVAEGEALAAARHGLDLLAALPAGSDFDDPAILFILHRLESDIKAASQYLLIPMRNGIILGAT